MCSQQQTNNQHDVKAYHYFAHAPTYVVTMFESTNAQS
jgi:hypothetical protein